QDGRVSDGRLILRQAQDERVSPTGGSSFDRLRMSESPTGGSSFDKAQDERVSPTGGSSFDRFRMGESHRQAAHPSTGSGRATGTNSRRIPRQAQDERVTPTGSPSYATPTMSESHHSISPTARRHHPWRSPEPPPLLPS